MNEDNQKVKSNAGAGIGDGFMMIIDPLGIIVQYVCQKKGYDVRTIGGLGLFSKLDKPGTKLGYHTTGHIITKSFVCLLGLNAWLNPLAWPFLIVIEALATLLNVYGNVKRYKKKGTLKK